MKEEVKGEKQEWLLDERNFWSAPMEEASTMLAACRREDSCERQACRKRRDGRVSAEESLADEATIDAIASVANPLPTSMIVSQAYRRHRNRSKPASMSGLELESSWFLSVLLSLPWLQRIPAPGSKGRSLEQRRTHRTRCVSQV